MKEHWTVTLAHEARRVTEMSHPAANGLVYNLWERLPLPHYHVNTRLASVRQCASKLKVECAIFPTNISVRVTFIFKYITSSTNGDFTLLTLTMWM